MAGVQPIDFHRLESGVKKLPPAVALTLRLLVQYGEPVSPLKRMPTLGEFRAFIERIDSDWKGEPKRFALLFGRDRTATHRWFLRQDAAMALPMTLRRCMQVIWLRLHSVPANARKAALHEIYELNIRELVLQGYDEARLRNNFMRVRVAESEPEETGATSAPRKRAVTTKKVTPSMKKSPAKQAKASKR